MSEADGGSCPEGMAKPLTPKKMISKRTLVALAVALLLGTSGLYVWYEYYRHWTIDDLEDAVVVVNEYMPIYWGFDHDLEGRTVTVEVEIESFRSISTSLGQLNFIYPEGGRFVTLLQWGEMDAGAGDRVQLDVTFEWCTVNGWEGVYSPQVGTPGLAGFVGSDIITKAVNQVQGECMLGIEDLGDDIVVEVGRIEEPIPLEMARCFLRVGTEFDTLDYVDVMGWYRDNPCLDAIDDLTDPDGPNGTIEFSDRNADGYLDDGDTFTLHGLLRPEESSGAQTYLLIVERDLYPDEDDTDYASMTLTAYLVMTHEGLLWSSDGQYRFGTAFSTPSPDCITVTVDYMSSPTRWNETDLLVMGGDSYVWLPIDASALSAGPGASFSCGVVNVSDVSFECVVTDTAGNGYLDETDRFDFIARNGTAFYEGMAAHMAVHYAVSETTIIEESLEFIAEPVSDCLVSVGDDSATLTLAPVHNGTDKDYELVEIVWDNIVVRLTDGTNVIEWNPTYDELSEGEPVEWTSDGLALGDLSFVCSVADLQGNGLADAGDRIEVASADMGVFDPDTSYVLSMVYSTTGATIFSATFTGQA